MDMQLSFDEILVFYSYFPIKDEPHIYVYVIEYTQMAFAIPTNRHMFLFWNRF